LRDAPLLILDEVTSNLDPDTETLIQDAIRSLVRGRTVLIVAHRLNTVMDADQIVVLDHGCVVEIGRHTDLLVRGGLYRRLVAVQNDQGDSLRDDS
ncbi:MAG TPA: hypothetical protein VMT24_11260, partial [Aggregatilineaceae bacterium]|nr:hypothetical protein [Aggregatilineaceae bacterium]